MKNKNIFNLIIEGPDGVGKSTLISGLFKHYNFRYMCYHRGELSNLVYARKFNRKFYSTQRGLPFIYIYLTCSKEVLKSRLEQRDISDEEELKKISDIELFDKAYEDMKNDFDIIKIDTSNLTEAEVLNKTISILDERQKENMTNSDVELSSWNKMYDESCRKLGLTFNVLDNQPYIDDEPMMVESTCHNGTYETFNDNGVYDNLIYAYAYPKIEEKIKTFDFHYIINSKLKRRHEVLDYYKAFNDNNLSCITSSYALVPDYQKFEKVDRLFGKDFLEKISEAKATVYCGRDLEYLKLQTARLYEAIIAQNIVFVDKESDKDCDILKKIYGKKIDILYVTPDTIVENYIKIMNDTDLYHMILRRQNEFLSNEFKKLEKRYGKNLRTDIQ